MDGGLPNIFAVPVVQEQKAIDKVIDLRHARVQEWFFEVFSKEEWLNIHFPLPNMSVFFDLLPFLVGQKRGGNVLTQAVGRELRLWGVNGLVYPSARCDAVVLMEDGDVVDWYGWNLVDYSKTGGQEPQFNPRDAAVMIQMPQLASDIQHGLKFFGVPMGQMTIRQFGEGRQRGSWQLTGLEALNTFEWKKKLTPSQRTLLGMPADEALLARPEEGLHPIERLFQNRFHALLLQRGKLPLDGGAIRRMLGGLAKGLMHVPFGGKVAVSRQKMDEILQLKDQFDVFTEIAAEIGFLVEEPKDYFAFVDVETFEYFTSVW